MIGGIFTSFVVELVVYPVIYEIWKWHFEMRRAGAELQPAALAEYGGAIRLTPDDA